MINSTRRRSRSSPLFAHEPLLAGVTTVCEPFCGSGNLVIAMRARGLTVHASDIVDRGCPDSTVLDFLEMTHRPRDCDVLLSNPPFSIAMEIIEHAWRLGFRLVVLLLEPSFLHTADRFERLHPRGHLRRIYPLAERLKDMHDAAHIAKAARRAASPGCIAGTCSTATTAATPRPSRFRSTIRRRACRGRPARAASNAAALPAAAIEFAVLLGEMPAARPSQEA